MNNFNRGFNNFFNNINNCNYNNNFSCGWGSKERKLMNMYYNLYNTGCGLDMFVKGCNLKKMMCIIRSFRR